jgi:creatinine amidohydrolase
MLLAHRIAVRVAREVGGVVHPAVFCGTERERSPQMLSNIGFEGDEWVVGMDFPDNSLKSLYYPEESFALIVREAIALLIEQGYRLIVLVNGHGAANQMAVLQRLEALFNAEGRVKVLFVKAFPIEYDGTGMPENEGGHADLKETAAVLASWPDCVDMTKLPPGDQPLRNTDWAIVDGASFSGDPTPDHTVRPERDPRNATREIGEAQIESAVARLAEKVRRTLGQVEGWANRSPSC